MKRNKLDKNNHTIFEMLSDISLSTLGLFLIFFIVYVLNFTSSGLNLRSQITNFNNQISQLNQLNFQLTAEKERLNSENQKLNQVNSQLIAEKEGLISENQKLDQELMQANQKHQYTGYYTGQYEMKFYENGCDNDYYILISEEHSLLYLQSLNIMTYSIKSKKGVISYKIVGNLQGNSFIGSFSDEYQRTRNIVRCGPVNNSQLRINFSDSQLDFYMDMNSNEKFVLRKIG